MNSNPKQARDVPAAVANLVRRDNGQIAPRGGQGGEISAADIARVKRN
jgi:hypothetical protein